MNIYFNFNNVTELYSQRAEHLKNNYWFVRAKKTGPTSASYLKSFDKIISTMGENDKNSLRKKFSNIISKKAKNWKDEYDNQFRDILTEIIGYGYLIDRGCKPIFKKTPDLVGIKGSDVIAMECKNITSHYNNAWVENDDVNYKVLFSEKMKRVLDKAKKQVSVVKNAEKIIFININTDIKYMFQSPQEQAGIIDYLQKESDSLKSKSINVFFFREYNYHSPLL